MQEQLHVGQTPSKDPWRHGCLTADEHSIADGYAAQAHPWRESCEHKAPQVMSFSKGSAPLHSRKSY